MPNPCATERRIRRSEGPAPPPSTRFFALMFHGSRPTKSGAAESASVAGEAWPVPGRGKDASSRSWGGSGRYPYILWNLAAKSVKFFRNSHAAPGTGGDLRLQVLLREGRSRVPGPGDRGRRPERLRQVQHLR